MRTQQFEFSQNTFGGALACTAIATLSACGFADNEIAEDKFKTYCSVGSQMWRAISTNTISVHEVLNKYSFFNENYTVESYQCCVADTMNDEGKYITLKKMLSLFNDELKGPRGAVFTDGIVSFAIGFARDKYWLFDSHCNACLCGGSSQFIQEKVCAIVGTMRIVDCTTFQSKDI